MSTFCAGLSRFQESGGICKISEAFSAYAGDVVTNYCFGFDYNHLGLEGFTDSFHDAFMAVSAFGHVAMQFPWMHPVSTHQVMDPTDLLMSLAPQLPSRLLE